MFSLFATCVIDTGGKFAASGGNFAAGAPGLEISLQILENIWNDPNVIFRSSGEDDSWKNLKQKILWHCPFKQDQQRDFWYASK